MDTLYVSDKVAAARFSVSVATWWRWTRSGRAPQPIRLSPGCTRWYVPDLDRFALEQRRKALSEA